MTLSISKLIATFFYTGLLRPAPGSWGSAAAIPVGYLLHVAGGFPALMGAVVLVFFIGWWATWAQTRGQDNHDPSEIVIDEVAGQWIALLPLSAGMWFAGQDPWLFPYPGWVSAFIFFRLFDILKPGPVGWADRKSTAFGVMLDDVIAGVMAAIVVTAAAAFSHPVLM
ncbi:MAG: phosphatidylglycerophosphatase A [Rhodobacterales bacterium]|nr:MAG: phosphatidylglycerophosphatase A [Rhodobacterales bacterium]